MWSLKFTLCHQLFQKSVAVPKLLLQNLELSMCSPGWDAPRTDPVLRGPAQSSRRCLEENTHLLGFGTGLQPASASCPGPLASFDAVKVAQENKWMLLRVIFILRSECLGFSRRKFRDR